MGGFEQEKHLKPLIAAVIILLLLCFGWIYSSHQQRLKRFERKVESALNELTQLNVSLLEYQDLEQQLQALKSGSSATQRNLIATVEDATERVSARSQLIYVRPQPDKTREDLIEEGVEIKLEKLELHQLVELLYQFDQSGQKLKVSQLRVRTRFDNPEQLDTSITLSRFREKR
jgi:predicted negative regulator of RcsB-dependent stress response